MKLKKGDWCFCEFELSLVKEVRDGGYLTLGTGVVEKSGMMEDRCFPLDYSILQISQSFRSYYDELHHETKKHNLNWPDIFRWFVDRWVLACRERQDEKNLKNILDSVAQFCRDIRNECRDTAVKQVGGIYPFSRR